MIRLLLFLLSISLFADKSDEILAMVGEEKISFEMLEKAHNKNLKEDDKKFADLNQQEAKDFIELYVKYRLKVLDAIDKGYLQDSAVQEEIKTNQKLLAESYYIDRELVDPKVELMLKRRFEEFQFGFIIIPKTSEDTIGGGDYYPKKIAEEALAKINSGTSFEDVAKEYSKDARTAEDGGKVDNWVTGGKIQKEFEDILYDLKPGEYHNEVIETDYGYFILKLIQKEPRKKIKSSHILVNYWGEDKYSEEQAYALADSIYQAIKSGASFDEMAKKYSRDETSAYLGGSLGNWYSRSTGFDKTGNNLLTELTDRYFSMKPGDITEPVNSNFGLHILRLDSIKDLDQDSERNEMRTLYKQRYYLKEKSDFLDSVALTFGFKFNDQVATKIQTYVDSSLTTLGVLWIERLEPLKNEVLFSFNKKDFSIEEIFQIVQSRRELKGFQLHLDGLRALTKKYIESRIYDLVSENMINKYEEFSDLMKEFEDGIILFKAENEQVWSKRAFDEEIGKAYWDSTRLKYKTKFKFDLDEIFILNKDNADALFKEVTIENFSEKAELKTQREGFREKQGKHGWVEQNKDKIAKIVPISEIGKNKIYGPLKFGLGWSIIRVNDYKPPRVMTYDEAKPYISQPVQDIVQSQLRDEWLAEVRKKHKVRINDKKLNEIFN